MYWSERPSDAALTTISRRPSLPGDDSRSTRPQLLLDILLDLLCLLVVGVVRGVGALQQNDFEPGCQRTHACRAHAALALDAERYNRIYSFRLELGSELWIRLESVTWYMVRRCRRYEKLELLTDVLANEPFSMLVSAGLENYFPCPAPFQEGTGLGGLFMLDNNNLEIRVLAMRSCFCNCGAASG
jgi:hypothetical protein